MAVAEMPSLGLVPISSEVGARLLLKLAPYKSARASSQTANHALQGTNRTYGDSEKGEITRLEDHTIV